MGKKEKSKLKTMTASDFMKGDEPEKNPTTGARRTKTSDNSKTDSEEPDPSISSESKSNRPSSKEKKAPWKPKSPMKTRSTSKESVADTIEDLDPETKSSQGPKSPSPSPTNGKSRTSSSSSLNRGHNQEDSQKPDTRSRRTSSSSSRRSKSKENDKEPSKDKPESVSTGASDLAARPTRQSVVTKRSSSSSSSGSGKEQEDEHAELQDDIEILMDVPELGSDVSSEQSDDLMEVNKRVEQAAVALGATPKRQVPKVPRSARAMDREVSVVVTKLSPEKYDALVAETEGSATKPSQVPASKSLTTSPKKPPATNKQTPSSVNYEQLVSDERPTSHAEKAGGMTAASQETSSRRASGVDKKMLGVDILKIKKERTSPIPKPLSKKSTPVPTVDLASDDEMDQEDGGLRPTIEKIVMSAVVFREKAPQLHGHTHAMLQEITYDNPFTLATDNSKKLIMDQTEGKIT
jgi:hypothetical protein